MQKIFKSIFNENIDLFCYVKKFPDLYLMKIQISFCLEKKVKSVFNENTDQFLYAENFGFLFNDNTNQFCFFFFFFKLVVYCRS